MIWMCMTWRVPPHQMFKLLRPVLQAVPLDVISLDSKTEEEILLYFQWDIVQRENQVKWVNGRMITT